MIRIAHREEQSDRTAQMAERDFQIALLSPCVRYLNAECSSRRHELVRLMSAENNRCLADGCAPIALPELDFSGDLEPSSCMYPMLRALF
jgi:hypothetical protein